MGCRRGSRVIKGGEGGREGGREGREGGGIGLDKPVLLRVLLFVIEECR